MNAKTIAQEVVDWYRSHLDCYDAHSVNVRNHLHGPVVSLTHKILCANDDDEFASSSETPPTATTTSQDEKKTETGDAGSTIHPVSFLHLNDNTNNNSNNNSTQLYEALGRRSKARMDAFLAGVSYAVPDGDVPGKHKHHTTHNQHNKKKLEKPPAAPKTATKKAPPPPPQQQPTQPPENPTPKQNPQKIMPNLDKSPVLTSLNHHGKALLRSVSASADGSSHHRHQQPQMRPQELLVRLELYIRSLYRVQALQRDCVVAAEPRKASQARVTLIVSAFITTVGCVAAVSPSLTRLLTCLTRELLSVECLGEGLMRVIRRLVNEYERGTSFASLAFLSSPEASAETRLTPMVTKYIRYLQTEWKNLERECELERMLALSLDSNMRRYFKTAEFQSIGHLLEACQGFRNELQNIELMPYAGMDGTDNNYSLCNNAEAVQQAVRDLQREVITINGFALPAVTSRGELIDLLSQSLNSRTLTAPPEARRTSSSNNADASPDSIHKRSESCPSFVSTEPNHDEDHSSLGDGDWTGKQLKRKSSLNRRASFHLSTVDVLTRRLLIAASRTGTGGDAYFIVRDLFGDEDVEVVPSTVLPHHVRASRVGSIEIQVRLGSVTIKCHGSFDVYPKSLVGLCEPLIQLHTTTAETIYLQEKRSSDSSSEDGVREDDGSSFTDGMGNLVLQERKTHKTGWRMLSIRPALYEKVQVWNTPS